jgi:hypothetical protein
MGWIGVLWDLYQYVALGGSGSRRSSSFPPRYVAIKSVNLGEAEHVRFDECGEAEELSVG